MSEDIEELRRAMNALCRRREAPGVRGQMLGCEVYRVELSGYEYGTIYRVLADRLQAAMADEAGRKPPER